MNVCSTIHDTHTYTDYLCTGSGRQLGAPYNCSKSSRERAKCVCAQAQTRCHFWEICSACAACSVRGTRPTTTWEQCTAQRVSLAKAKKKATKLLWWQWQWQCTGYGQGAAAAAAAHITKRRQHYCHLNINRQTMEEAGGRRQRAGGVGRHLYLASKKVVHWAVGESWAWVPIYVATCVFR